MAPVKRAQAKPAASSRTRMRPKISAHEMPPAAGAHAARHLINEDATPGAGALIGIAGHNHRYVDGGAG